MNSPSTVTLEPIEPAMVRPISNLTLLLALSSRPQQRMEIITSELESEIRKENMIINNNGYFSFMFKETVLEMQPKIDDNTDYGMIG